MSDQYDEWADKQRAMGRTVPETTAPYVAPSGSVAPSENLPHGQVILFTDPEFTVMATHFKVRCNRCELAFFSENILKCRIWSHDHKCGETK